MGEEKQVQLRTYLVNALREGASDLHLQPGSKPYIRVNDELAVFQTEALSEADVVRMVRSTMSDSQYEMLQLNHELDYSFENDRGRFRVNAYHAQNRIEAVIRLVSSTPKSFEKLELPTKALQDLSQRPDGLVLVAGSTGSGKSTTLSAIVDFINSTLAKRIITIENPIEVVHRNRKAMISQREIGSDTKDFVTALRSALRQDPDVIMIGEIRDRDTAAAALQAAQTGHLVISTIHAGAMDELITRFTGLFPAEDRDEVLSEFAQALRGVVIQRLVEGRVDKEGKSTRVPVTEILINTPRASEAMRSHNEGLDDVMANGDYNGMHTLDQELVRMVKDRMIVQEVAVKEARSTQNVIQGLKRLSLYTPPAPVSHAEPSPGASTGEGWVTSSRASQRAESA